MQWDGPLSSEIEPTMAVAIAGGVVGGLCLGYVVGRVAGTTYPDAADGADRRPVIATALVVLCLLTLAAAVAVPVGETAPLRWIIPSALLGIGLQSGTFGLLTVEWGEGVVTEPVDVTLAFVAASAMVGGLVAFGGGNLVGRAAGTGTAPWWGLVLLAGIHWLGITIGAAAWGADDGVQAAVAPLGIAILILGPPTLAVAAFAMDVAVPIIDPTGAGAAGWAWGVVSLGLPIAFVAEFVTAEETGTESAEDLGLLLGIAAVVVAPVLIAVFGGLSMENGFAAVTAGLPVTLVAAGSTFLLTRRRERSGARNRTEEVAARIDAYDGDRETTPAVELLSAAETALDDGVPRLAYDRCHYAERAIEILERLDEFDARAATLAAFDSIDGRAMDAVATDGGRVYLPLGDGSVAALNADGECDWRLAPKEMDSPRESHVAVGDGTVVVTFDEVVVGVDTATGEVAWIQPSPEYLEALAVTGGGTACFAAGTEIAGIEAATGAPEWSTDLDDRVPGGSWRAADATAADGIIWITCCSSMGNGLVVAVDPADGGIEASVSLQGRPRLATDGRTVYAVGEKELLIASAAEPDRCAKRPLGTATNEGTPAIAAGRKFVALGGTDGLLVFHATSLRQALDDPVGRLRSGLLGATVTGDRIDALPAADTLAVADRRIWVWESDGDIGWYEPPDGYEDDSTVGSVDSGAVRSGAFAPLDDAVVAVTSVAVGLDVDGPRWLYPGRPGSDLAAAAEASLVEAVDVSHTDRQTRGPLQRAARMATTAAEASMTAVRWRALVSVERGRRAIAAARDGDQMAADLDRAVERLEVAEAALADAAYGSAAEAGEAAALAAEPRLEPLLDRARRRVDEADAAFDDGRYDDAIGAWEAARELYERARTLARERDEEPMAERLAESIGRLRENVAGAEQQRANERMRALAAEATEAVDDGDERFDDGEYDAARDRFERAADTYREAADLAAEHGFEDEKQLREGAERAAESAGDCRLAALADRLDDAEEALDGAEGIDDARAVREAFESVADDLSELSVPDSRTEERDRLVDRAHRGIVQAGTGAGRAMMAEAEGLYDDGERFEAKERYDAAREALREVSDLAIEYGLTAERGEVSRLVDTCIENAELLSDELASVGSVEVDIERADAVRTASTDPPSGRERGRPAGAEPGTVGGVDEELRSALPEHDLLERIGGGGNADVHRVQLTDGREAALKVPRWQGTLSRRVVEEFTDEAETWVRLHDHDHIVDVLDYGTAPHPWILMEYVAGGSLADRLSDLSLRERLAALVDVCDAVHHAHRHGVAHADLKPANVLLTDVPDDSGSTPRARVADWGLARTLLDDTVSREGLTATYAAPEQVDPGSYDGVDDLTDIYQLGVVVYEAATGRPPFDHESPSATVNAVLHESPPEPSEVAPELPAELDGIVTTAMAREKAERYETVVNLRNALESVRVALPNPGAHD